jgi:hypothetical protein
MRDSKLSTVAVEGKVVGGTSRSSRQSDLVLGGKVADHGLDISGLHGAVQAQEVSAEASNVAAAELVKTQVSANRRRTELPWKFQR